MEKMKALVARLNAALRAYEQEEQEIMTNLDYDRLYDALVEMELETGIILADSPTQKVGFEVLSSLPKEKHAQRMLSLDKTKEVAALKGFLKGQKADLSWKLDGLTIVLTYREGDLFKAVTRGNGEIGEVITNNARVFKNIPLSIPFKGELILRGEAVIKYSDFERINRELEGDELYKNPRNLCSGTVRQLNNEITAKRNVHFYAFSLVAAQGAPEEDSKYERLIWLKSLGFDVVETVIVDEESIEGTVEAFAGKIGTNDFASDGLVLTLDSVAYSIGLGTTAKFPKDSIAFKWQDEIAMTRLVGVEWNASRTGLINPIALFEPVELEGTTVARASVHNISIVEALELGVGDEIEVYKANMIIPQIAENRTRSGNLEIPARCPVCHQVTEIRQTNDVKALYCNNPECSAKKIKTFAHYVSRNAMNIEGLSEATLEKLIEKGCLENIGDLYRLERYKDLITEIDGFGEKSYQNLITAIEKSRQVPLARFIYGLGISNVGLSNARLLCKEMDYDLDKIMAVEVEELAGVQGFGEIIAQNVVSFFAEETNRLMIRDLLQYVVFEPEKVSAAPQVLAGKTFVITGSVERYANRNALKAYIESLGGKVTGSVTGKTDYLINNEVTSSSSKNKTAQGLGIPILDEDAFEKLLDGLGN